VTSWPQCGAARRKLKTQVSPNVPIASALRSASTYGVRRVGRVVDVFHVGAARPAQLHVAQRRRPPAGKDAAREVPALQVVARHCVVRADERDAGRAGRRVRLIREHAVLACRPAIMSRTMVQGVRYAPGNTMASLNFRPSTARNAGEGSYHGLSNCQRTTLCRPTAATAESSTAIVAAIARFRACR
jgi:hypothetical protein